MSVSAWTDDLGLLLGGLWMGLLEAAVWLGSHPLSDLLSLALMGQIAFLIFSDILGARRCRRWGGVLLYTGFVYATLPWVPDIWKRLYIHTNGRIDLVGGTVAAAMGLGIVSYVAIGRRERRWWIYTALALLGGVYAGCVVHLHTSPAERLHLAEYGLLSLLTFRALSVDLGYRAAYLWGWVVASGLGGLDEVIQGLLPNRVGEWSDAGLNALASGLGMIVVILTAGGSRRAEDAGGQTGRPSDS